jgi:hypothetical protein
MTMIAKGARCVTLINVFTLEPAKQHQLVVLLIHATEVTMKHLPTSANIHKSLDGTRVTNKRVLTSATLGIFGGTAHPQVSNLNA